MSSLYTCCVVCFLGPAEFLVALEKLEFYMLDPRAQRLFTACDLANKGKITIMCVLCHILPRQGIWLMYISVEIALNESFRLTSLPCCLNPSTVTSRWAS